MTHSEDFKSQIGGRLAQTRTRLGGGAGAGLPWSQMQMQKQTLTGTECTKAECVLVACSFAKFSEPDSETTRILTCQKNHPSDETLQVSKGIRVA
eukprot:3580633-Rhodomonas_salina.1